MTPVRRPAISSTEEVLRATLDRTQRQLQAVVATDHIAAIGAGNVQVAAREVAALASRVTGCERVSLWLFNEDGRELRCIESYDATPGRHSSGLVLREQDFRSEFEALRHARYVDADDPLTDPRTTGYVETYLKPLGITSMLDAVVEVSGRSLGVLCFEHVARAHHWEQDEIAFACHLADKLGLALMTRKRLETEADLRASEAALAEAQAVAHVGSWTYSVRSGTLVWSREACRIFGIDPATFVPSHEDFLARVHPDDRAAFDRNYRDSVATHGVHAIDHRIVMPDGTVRIVHRRGRTVYDAEGRPLQSIGTVQDITDRKQAEDALQFANTLLRTEMEASPDGILVVDQNGRIMSMNRRFADMFALPADLRETHDDAPVLAKAMATMKAPQAFLARVQDLYAHPDQTGHEELETTDGRWIDRDTAALRNADGLYLGRVWFFRDITDRKRQEAQVRHTAQHDSLTGLPNRKAFLEALELTIARATRSGSLFAVLYVDLDRFKDVNDTLGHPAGDALLQLVAERIQSRVRTTDVVSRLGGDEFVLIASDLRDPTDAAALAESVIVSLAEPFTIQGNDVQCGASVGISAFGPEAFEADTFVSQADVALLRAKSEGRGTFRFFTEAMDSDVRTRIALAADLREALAAGQLLLEYQPQVDLRSRRITGLEALVRWRHPTRGLLAPDIFIPVAEASGLIRPLGRWVLHEGCRQARVWLDAGLLVGRIALNLSSLQFRVALDLEQEIAAALEDTGLPPDRLELELTEAVLMAASEEHGEEVLTRLRAQGMSTAIDDFGTGSSSLDYPRRVPVDRIKLARDFVARITTDPESAGIVKATIGLARELGIVVIAAGVSSEAQLARLTKWGCREAQGFFLAPPLGADAATRLLARGRLTRAVPARRRSGVSPHFSKARPGARQHGHA